MSSCGRGGLRGIIKGQILFFRPSQSSGSLTQLYHGDPYEYRSRLSAHAITYARTEQNKQCPPQTHPSITRAPKSPSFPADTMTFLIQHNKGFLGEACAIIASYFQPLVRIPFITAGSWLPRQCGKAFLQALSSLPCCWDVCTSAPRRSFCFALPSSCFLFKVKIDLCPAGAGKFPQMRLLSAPASAGVLIAVLYARMHPLPAHRLGKSLSDTSVLPILMFTHTNPSPCLLW